MTFLPKFLTQPLSSLYRFCISLIICLVCSSTATAATQLVLADIADQLPPSLMARQILLQAYAQLAIEIKILELPNSRIKAMLENQSIDGMVYRLADSPLYDLQKITPALTYEEFAVFTVQKNFTVAGYSSLTPYLNGYRAGSKVLDDNLQGMRIETAPSMDSLFKKLAAGRTDTVIESRGSYCRVKKLGLDQIIMLEPALDKILGYHWLSARHQDLIPRLSAVLKKMEKDGSIRKIQEQTWKTYNANCAGA
ncbi:substrate-binding periplasmic protein [Undibacterium sp. Ren11W]|uniref:substrate-binding periplasmic protein n=1 Tax=Undibacterium sp. Ren11W TaxID=3413045 RepID=UPI003BF10ED7